MANVGTLNFSPPRQATYAQKRVGDNTITMRLREQATAIRRLTSGPDSPDGVLAFGDLSSFFDFAFEALFIADFSYLRSEPIPQPSTPIQCFGYSWRRPCGRLAHAHCERFGVAGHHRGQMFGLTTVCRNWL